jgi:aquaporin NIP
LRAFGEARVLRAGARAGHLRLLPRASRRPAAEYPRPRPKARGALTLVREPSLARRAAAEGAGTFALVFAGCGAIVTDAERHGSLGVVGVGLVFFLVLLAAIASLGHVSGAHFNPGVSLSFFLTRHLPARDLGAYVAAQMAAAVLAALLLLAVWPGQPADLGATVPTIAAGRALLLEAVLTAFLMLVIISVATDTRAVGAPAALAIAAAVGLASIAFGPLTGASLNTARSLGPALASGQWHDFWVYIAGPLAGAPLGAFAYQFMGGEHARRSVVAGGD